MEGGFLLNVVVGQGAAVLELLASKDKALLIRGDALLVLDLRLHVVDGIRALDLESNGLAGERLHEDLHSTAEAEDYNRIGKPIREPKDKPHVPR